MFLVRGVLRLIAFAFNLVLGLFLLSVGLLGWSSGQDVYLDVIPLVDGDALIYTLVGSGLFALLATGLAFRSRAGALLMLAWNALVVSTLVCTVTRSSYTFAGMDHFTNGVYLFALSLLALSGSWMNFRAARLRARPS